MYKYILESAGSINWMALFALLTFFFIFSCAIYIAFFKNKEEMNKVAALPLNDGTINTENS